MCWNKSFTGEIQKRNAHFLRKEACGEALENNNQKIEKSH